MIQGYKDFFSLNSCWIGHTIYSLSKYSQAYPYVQLNAAISNSENGLNYTTEEQMQG